MGFRVNDMVNTGGLPVYLIKPLLDRFDISVFVETGTAGGESIKIASELFQECHTIELIEGRTKIDTSLLNVNWYTGNSIDILPSIIDVFIQVKNGIQDGGDPKYRYALFFLDAHYSGSEPNESEYKECYLLEELEIISRYRDDAIIVIDDARLFFGHPPYPNNPQEWANIQDIFCLLKEKFPYHYSTITDDYIISIPDRLREPIDAEWRSNFHIRYPNAETKLKADARNVFNAIQKYLQ